MYSNITEYIPHCTLHPITSLFYIWKYVPFDFLHQFHPLPAPTSHATPCSQQFVLCVYQFSLILFVCFRFHILVKSYSISLSLTHLAQHNTFNVYPWCDQWHYFILFFWLSNISLCICNTYLSIYLLRDIQIVPIFWLLLIVLL